MKTQEQQNRDIKQLHLLEKVQFDPIFIIGQHRSGTTLLYKTLVATKCFNFVSAYHIIKYDEILNNYTEQKEDEARQELASLFASLGLDDRAIDKVKITPDLPEEYGFILVNYGYESFINQENLAKFIEISKKIQYTGSTEKPILLKNPWCYEHFLYIKEVFPNAKFIFIHRNPINVINSKLKAARTLLSKWNDYTALLSRNYHQIFKNPFKLLIYRLAYSKYFNLGLNRVLKGTIETTKYYLENIDRISKKDCICINFEDLCEKPRIIIESILEFAGVEVKENIEYEKLIQSRPVELLPEVEKNQTQIREQLKPYLLDRGYSI